MPKIVAPRRKAWAELTGREGEGALVAWWHGARHGASMERDVKRTNPPPPNIATSGVRPSVRSNARAGSELELTAVVRARSRRVQGKVTFKELGRRLDLQESDHLEASYMGYANRRLG